MNCESLGSHVLSAALFLFYFRGKQVRWWIQKTGFKCCVILSRMKSSNASPKNNQNYGRNCVFFDVFVHVHMKTFVMSFTCGFMTPIIVIIFPSLKIWRKGERKRKGYLIVMHHHDTCMDQLETGKDRWFTRPQHHTSTIVCVGGVQL